MKGCGVSIVGIALGSIVALWIIWHIGTIWSGLNSLLKLVTGKQEDYMTVKSKLKNVVAFCTKPIVRVIIVTNEEKMFLAHANKFLDPSAIKPEHRNKENIK